MHTYIRTYVHTLRYVTLHAMSSNYITSHHITLHHITSHCNTWHYINTYIHAYIHTNMHACMHTYIYVHDCIAYIACTAYLTYVTIRDITSHYTTPRDITSRRNPPHDTTPPYVTLCHTQLHTHMRAYNTYTYMHAYRHTCDKQETLAT